MCAVAPAVGHGQTAQLSLADAQAYALEHNISVQNAALQIEDARGSVNELLRTGLPQVNAEVGYTHFPALPTSLIPAEFVGGTAGEFEELQFGTKHNARAGLTLNQLLFDGTYLVGLKAARMFVDLQRKEVERTESQVRAEVARAYYAVLIAGENVRLLKQNLEVASKLHYETQQIFDAGYVEEIEVDRLKLTLDNVQTQINSAERQHELAASLLKFQIGMDLSEPIALTDSLRSLTTTHGDLAATTADHQLRKEWEIVEMQKNLVEVNIKRLTRGYYPSLSLWGNYEYSAQRSSFDFFEADKPWFQMASWGVTLKVPIFDSFQKAASIQKEKNRLQMVMNSREQLRQSINLEVAQAQTAYTNAREQLNTQTGNLALAEKIMNTARMKYAEGVGSSLEVNSAQTTLLQTQTALINALYELLIAKTDLEKALGII